MISHLKACAVHGLIAALLALMIVQTFPGAPEWLVGWPRAAAQLTGWHQGTWNLFAPEPDNENHRLRAVIEYHDGEIRHWQSPDWRAQSIGERFVGHRRSEYYDKLRQPFYEPAMPGFVRWLALMERPDAVAAARPKRVEVHADYYEIPDPRWHGWQTPAAPLFDQSTLLYAEEFP
jgi:hypothetical protein